MAKWEYLRVLAMSPGSTVTVKRDKDGLFLEWWKLRLDPEQQEWEEGRRVFTSDFLAHDAETRYWRKEIDVLNRLGQVGWERVTTHVMPSNRSRPAARWSKVGETITRRWMTSTS